MKFAFFRKNKNILHDSFFAFAGNFLGKGIMLLSSIFIARFLQSSQYGELGIFRDIILYTGIFSTLGLGYSATKYVSEYQERSTIFLKSLLRFFFSTTLLVSIIVAGLIVILAGIISERLNISTPALLYGTAVIIIFNAVNNLQIGVLAGFKEFKNIAINTSVANIVGAVFSVVLTIYFGLTGAISGLFIFTIINVLLNQLSLKKRLAVKLEKAFPIQDEEKLPGCSKILSFSIPIAIQEAFYTVSSLGGAFILLHFATKAQLGLYSVSTQWFSIILFIPAVLRNVVLSHFSSYLKNKQYPELFGAFLKINLFCSLTPFLIVLAATPLIVTMYGDSYHNLTLPFIILISASIFDTCSMIFQQDLIANGRTWLLLFFRAIRDIGILILAFIFLALSAHPEENGATCLSVAFLIMHIIYFFILLLFLLHNRKNFQINYAAR